MSTRFWGSTYTKIAFAVVFGTAGLLAAAYVGRAILERPEVAADELISGPVSESNALDDRYVNFGTGDLFPREPYWDADGNQGRFSDLVMGNNTLFYFASMGCEPCVEELAFLRRNRGKLRTNVQLIVVLWKDAGTTRDLYEGIFKDMRVIYYDRQTWTDRYAFDFWPVLVGVDYSGYVQHIQLGFSGSIDHEPVSYFFDANQ